MDCNLAEGVGELGALLPSKQIFSVTFQEAESLES